MNALQRKNLVKLAHSIGAVGLTGGFAAHIILLTLTPVPDAAVIADPARLQDYALMRAAIHRIDDWLLFPSLALVLCSGLLSMAIHRPFHDAGWVWLKALLGITTFEGTLMGISGPADRAAAKAAAVLAGDLEPAALLATAHEEATALWVLLGVALANIVLAVMRPRFYRPPARSTSRDLDETARSEITPATEDPGA